MDRPRRAPMNLKSSLVAAAFLAVLMAGVFLLLEMGNPSPGVGSPLDAAAADRGAEQAADDAPIPAPTETPRRAAWTAETQQLFMKGQRSYAIGEYQAAIEAYGAALAVNPDLEDVHLGMALARERLEDWEPAYRSMRRYLELTGAVPERGIAP